MEVYNYKAKSPSGEIISGIINAETKADVASHIKEQGLFVTQIKKVVIKKSFLDYQIFEENINLYDLAVFCRQFSTLISAGVPIVNTLTILIEQTEKTKFKRIIKSLEVEVLRGTSLSETLKDYPKVFPELMVNMVNAGEIGGILESVMERLAVQYEKEYRMTAKFKSAMTYPAMVIIVATIAVAIILTFVMPTFQELFASLNSELPWPTLIVIAASDFIVESWLLALSFIVLLIIVYKQLMKKREFRLWTDGLFLKLPVLGLLYNKIIISRFAVTFAGLSRSGVPILESLEIVSKATGSLTAEEVLIKARANVQTGNSLSEPMRNSKLFPPIVVNLVSIGEETGTLDVMLDRVSEFYDAEVEDMLQRLQSLLDPILMVFLGSIIGFIAVAMLLPMFDIISKIGG